MVFLVHMITRLKHGGIEEVAFLAVPRLKLRKQTGSFSARWVKNNNNRKRQGGLYWNLKLDIKADQRKRRLDIVRQNSPMTESLPWLGQKFRPERFLSGIRRIKESEFLGGLRACLSTECLETKDIAQQT